MKDHPQRPPPSAAHFAHPMPQHPPMHPARPVGRALPYREDHAFALAQRHDLRSRLLARTLLDDDELAARKIAAGLVQKERRLQREDVLAIEILVQAVVVAGAVGQQQRRRPHLARVVATLQHARQRLRKAAVFAQPLRPTVGDPR
ncbi:hypothetical protein CCNA_03935 [Caulobacter vibrioides NA1000]|uniref:Uncharacterized protein n=1 Tax=Caulobacter vibrioides (strain NA1000 / CB15N) TaxID=565050 RepID=A0A0H3IWC5_CAUVN|nr:hypothetical protein [Caulobacter vibrioides]YP_009020507.1 hypothetical protein CCNA_03935 [Caulobacter vibrioides NA1000]AHI88538.1 hypothetical protein CCNA_03935 [Caulobacter vibrioides NA1000]